MPRNDLSPAQPLVRSGTVLFLVVLWLLMVLWNAWVSDDAYISFRTVDNLLKGFGMRWNVAERVQTFTHPLWLLLFLLPYRLIGDAYVSSLLLSSLLGAITLICLLRTARWNPTAGFLVVGLAAFSKAGVDYATSGLENPLTNLLLVLFVLVLVGDRVQGSRRVLWLSLLAALGMLNRMDCVLLYAPALALEAWRHRSWKTCRAMTLGMIPFVGWELFALVYYGFPFPNTAYAKLNCGWERPDLLLQGLAYLWNSLRWDFVTLPTVLLTGLFTLRARDSRRRVVAAGAWLYLSYVVFIGGDFMSGRFLVAPFYASLALVAGIAKPLPRPVWALAALWLFVAALHPRGPLLNAPFRAAQDGEGSLPEADRGITDERAFYYPTTGLARFARVERLPEHVWRVEGEHVAALAHSQDGLNLILIDNAVGFLGYYAGPDVHILDRFALCDALLARLPPKRPRQRIGHIERHIPYDYRAAQVLGPQRLKDPGIRALCEDLFLVTRGPLFTWPRWKAMWELNCPAGRKDARGDPIL